MTDQRDSQSNSPVFLVVDDDEQIRRLICLALTHLQPRLLIEAANGAEAQRQLQRVPVDVVITDMLMPEMDGRELMRWAQEHCPEPLWIVLSGLDTFDAAVEALQLGAFDFLAKPVRIGRLRVAARNALDQIRLRRDRERLYHELEQSNRQLSLQVDQLTNLCRILEDQSEMIQEDLARAEVIQRALLPQNPPKLEGWSVETLYRPGRHVGGDLYDVMLLDDRHMGVMIADAAGHGVAAAMLSVLLKHRLSVHEPETGGLLEPCEVLQRANAALRADDPAPGAFITAAYLVIDRDSGETRLAAAGHPPALWIHRGEGRLLDRTGPALGLVPDAKYAQETLTLEHGDRLLLYTDGLLDGGPAAPTHDQLIDALADPAGDRAELLQRFHQAATSDVSHDPDDITIILLERAEGVSQFDDTTGADHAAPIEVPAESLRMLHGVTDGRAFVSIAGNGSWMRCQTLYDATNALLERHKQVIIDLEGCNYLDSTCLGTLYELVASHGRAIRLQRVPSHICSLFDELSMEAVIERIEPASQPLPADMEPLAGSAENPARQAHRLLKAHEILASLSDENREQFQDVVSSLREDLTPARRAP